MTSSIEHKKLAAIIKTAKKCGVAKLKYGEIEIEFITQEAKKEEKIVEKIEETVSPDVGKTDVETNPIRQEREVTEEDLSNLILDNPSEYMRRLERGEIANEDFDQC